MSASTIRRLTAAAAVASLALLAACGSDPGTGGASAAPGGGSPSVSKLVPPNYRSAGTLTVATDASYAPNEFFGSNGAITGMDVDLAKAVVAAMGLRANVVNASFDSILPGLASGKYQLGVSSFTDTRQREQTVDFVTYFLAGTAFFEKAKGGPAVTGLDSLCGLRVALEKGTTQAEDAQAQSDRCVAGGRKPVTIEVFPDQGGANLALVSGRADVGMADSPLADYQVKRSGDTLKIVGATYGRAPYGIALPKGSGLAPAVQAALEELIANGSYQRILDTWGVSSGAISNPAVNGAAS